ncbi:MAG: sigma-70 family RNA polymerase sigma factor [Candidatus Hydrogenedentota bacterium]
MLPPLKETNLINEPLPETDPATWVAAHGDYLYRFAMQRLQNQSTVEDVVQDTFLAAIRARDSFSNQSTIRTWLTGILKHKIMDQYRAIRRELGELSADPFAATIDDIYDDRKHLKPPAQPWADDPREAFEKQEFWTQMDSCIQKLPERQSMIFTMREMDGYSSEEICKLLEITPTNYWVILHRGRVALRRCLEIHWFGNNKRGRKSHDLL